MLDLLQALNEEGEESVPFRIADVEDDDLDEIRQSQQEDEEETMHMTQVGLTDSRPGDSRTLIRLQIAGLERFPGRG
jgi:hypothetical protein